jgi:hypothetical protein
MSEHEVYPEEVRRHVWESLVSMLQVYTHAASLNGRQYEVTALSGRVSVKHHDSVLTICFHPETGKACWSLKRPNCEEIGEFHIDEHGELVFPAGPTPLDTAAIDWIAMLDHSAATVIHENVRS